MWLLDVNLPNGLVRVLKGYGLDCDTTIARGWRGYTNGRLAEVATNAGFAAILTKDRMFGESAAAALHKFPQFSVVILTLPQSRGVIYLQEFQKHWQQNPIEPIAGQVIEWPR